MKYNIGNSEQKLILDRILIGEKDNLYILGGQEYVGGKFKEINAIHRVSNVESDSITLDFLGDFPIK